MTARAAGAEPGAEPHQQAANKKENGGGRIMDFHTAREERQQQTSERKA